MRAAQAAVDEVRSGLAAVLAQLPDAASVEWRSPAQRRFEAGLDELSAAIGSALSALERSAAELTRAAAAAERIPAVVGGS